MTNTQKIGSIIIELMMKEAELKATYNKTEEQNSRTYRQVRMYEEAYTASGEDEEVGQKLDKAYNEHEETGEAMHEAEERLKAIEKALEALREATENIEWLGL